MSRTFEKYLIKQIERCQREITELQKEKKLYEKMLAKLRKGEKRR